MSTSDIISVCALLLNIVVACFAYRQLKGLRKSDLFKVIIDLDRTITERKATLDSISIEIHVLAESNKLNSEDGLRLRLKMVMAEEDYINCLEQLAFIILEKYFTERQAKDQYQIPPSCPIS
ncbi:hypothetical protein P0082_05285 [Candidatus Haliotispira prima]|uniref:Uncharacterized protein n=1 Tax=Candidatus Haliotispira prima TaxID=3034016 RepID=A0ABY8MJS1_9SPIO|nr:hypothetical protein P0082_05285 [Candidatus Haliotispira prima]